MTIDAIVFDIGGILEVAPDGGEPALAYGRVVARWDARLGLAPGTLLGRLDAMRDAGVVGRCTEAEWHASLAIPDAQLPDFLDDFWGVYLGELNAPLAAWLREQRPRHRTALLSNSFVGAREQEEARYGFSSLVDLVVYSHEVGIAKPDPRIYELTCERLDVAPENVLFLDDVVANVDAAHALGMRAILFEDNAQALAALARAVG